MNHALLSIMLILSLGCSKNITSKRPQSSEKQQAANRIRNEVALKIRNKFGLFPIGSGGQTMHKIEMLMLAFECRRSLTEGEAREILVKSVEEFVSALNNDEQVRPYLAEFPSTEKNIEIVIYIQDVRGGQVSTTQEFDIASCEQGYIKFMASNSEKYKLITLRQESFEEAKQLIKTTIPPLM